MVRIFAAVRALATLAAQCRDAVEFCRTPHAGADRLWAETSRRDEAERLAEQEAETEVSDPEWFDGFPIADCYVPDCGLGAIPDPSVINSDRLDDRLDAFEARLFALEKRVELTPARIDGYPPFNPSNHESSSTDGEAVLAGPPVEESPVASVSADLDATGPPNKQQLAWAAEALRDWSKGVACDAPRFWREIANQIDPEK